MYLFGFFLLSVCNKIHITISFKLENFAILWEGNEYSYMQDPHNGCDSGDLEAPSFSQWKNADASKNLSCLS